MFGIKISTLKYLFIACALVLFGCKKQSKSTIPETHKAVAATPLKYAKGFSVTNYTGYKVLEIFSPWPESDQSFKFALVDKNSPVKVNVKQTEFNGIITVPVTNIVVTSTTHLPALDLLEASDKLIGFPGTDYVSSELIRARIDSGFVKELGKNEGINTEVLLSLNPNVVVAFGIDGNNRTLETVSKANIPVIYNGDWIEESPLAKAEWIKLFGALFGKEAEADTVFNTIETNYLNAKAIAATVTEQPTVLSGAMHKDVWYLPSGTSSEAELLSDANVNYLWKNSTGAGSLALNFESVFTKAQNADIWLNPSYFGSYSDLKAANAHYAKFEAFKQKHIFTIANTQGATGGVLYYELGLSRPDLVLKDLIKISHPELLPEYQPFFFKPLK
ncbi:ABC transporter substrate-binding protein [Formosa sp. A9]|uniref:ABC transporter substrate-binding protein n=1 Tax=Formosa sp. A9 TaxID=3442641 RepID=UPI003EB6DC42